MLKEQRCLPAAARSASTAVRRAGVRRDAGLGAVASTCRRRFLDLTGRM